MLQWVPPSFCFLSLYCSFSFLLSCFLYFPVTKHGASERRGGAASSTSRRRRRPCPHVALALALSTSPSTSINFFLHDAFVHFPKVALATAASRGSPCTWSGRAIYYGNNLMFDVFLRTVTWPNGRGSTTWSPTRWRAESRSSMFDSEFCLSLGPQPLETLDRFWCGARHCAPRVRLPHWDGRWLRPPPLPGINLSRLLLAHATVGSRCSAAHRSTSCLFSSSLHDPDPLVALLLAAHGWLPDAIHEKKQDKTKKKKEREKVGPTKIFLFLTEHLLTRGSHLFLIFKYHLKRHVGVTSTAIAVQTALDLICTDFKSWETYQFMDEFHTLWQIKGPKWTSYVFFWSCE